jgi:signal transduction histidine kinase/DNA-binding response OmpR family regulator
MQAMVERGPQNIEKTETDGRAKIRFSNGPDDHKQKMADPMILVVDEQPNILQLCQLLLEKANFRVITADTTSQSLAILARQPIDLIVVDICLCNSDGFQLLHQAQNHQPEIASVIMTGIGDVEIAVEALHLGADGMVLKPFSSVELVAAVQQVLQVKQRWQDLERMSTLRPLFQLTEEFFSETNLKHLNRRVVKAVTNSLRCSFAGLYRFQVESGGYVQVATYGDELPTVNLVRRVVQELSDDSNIWINRSGPMQLNHRELLEPYPLSSLMAVPVSRKFERELLIAARRLEEQAFRGPDLEFLQMLGRQAGIAMENSRLYEELRASIRELEASREAMIRAEKIAAAGRMTASIAHELNNPLQSISNCLHLVGRQELPQSERTHYLELAQNELDRLIVTVRRTLDLYRPIARDRRLVNVNELISRVVRLMEPQLKERMIMVDCQFSEDLAWVALVGDQVQQVLMNLILNSMDAMPDGGEISIKTSPIVNGQIPGVEILVKDSGPGVSENDVERIFEPFFSTKEHGTGLGLPVSYSIVAAHGGSLNYIPQEGEGACFRIVFPENGVDEG